LGAVEIQGSHRASRCPWSVEDDQRARAAYGGIEPQPSPTTFLVTPGVTAKVADDDHVFKLGVNYRFGGAPLMVDDGYGDSIKDGAYARVSGTELEFGARYVYGWGRFQKDLGVAGAGVNGLASRLTYDDMNTNGGELFARLDRAELGARDLRQARDAGRQCGQAALTGQGRLQPAHRLAAREA
jgi:hypothetical protein